MKLGVFPVALVVAMAMAGVAENPPGNPLWEELEDEPTSGGAGRDGMDHTDIFNFDPASQTMAKSEGSEESRLGGCQRELLQCRHNLADLHERTLISAMYDKTEDHDVIKTCKRELKACREDLNDCKLGYQTSATAPADEDGSSTASPCKLEQMFFRRYAKHFIGLLMQEEEGDGAPDGSPLEAEVRLALNAHGWRKLRQFVRQKGKVRLVDAHDLLTDMLAGVQHTNGSGPTGWLHRLTGMETTDITFYALLCLLSIVVVVFEAKTNASWWQQFCAVMFVLFMISLAWNWVSLYKKEFAAKMSRRMVAGTEMPSACTPDNMTWWDSLSAILRHQFSFQKDQCEVYHKDVLVDPIYEVPPTKAITYTLSSMFLEPLQQLGKHLSDFHRELLADLPYAAWLPALLSVYLLPVMALLALCYWPRWGGRGGREGREEAAAAWRQVRRLEAQLEERDNAVRRQGQRHLEEMEVLGREGYMAVQPAPAPHLGRDVRPLAPEQPGLAGQRQLPQDYPAQAAGPERPRVGERRRTRGSSDSDVVHHHYHRQQQQHLQQRQPIYRGDLGRSYQGDVSAGDESSDEMDAGDRQRPCALTLEPLLPVAVGAQGHRPRAAPSSRGSASPPPPAPCRPGSTMTEILKQPVESPHSEMDSERDHSASGEADGALRSRRRGSPGKEPTIRGDPLGRRNLQQAAAGPDGAGDEEEAKLRRDPRPATLGPALTPASSTDSEPFPASPPACDSPSSVSVIEGDSSPASAGSVDGDSHLRGLGTSLSGSIDVIEPIGARDGAESGQPSEDGQESDEFEVLSREQCQSEEAGH